MIKYTKYLFVPAIILLVAGWVGKLVTGSWSPLLIGLAVAGMVFLLLWLAWLSSTQGFWRRRSTQAGTNAVIATGATLVILGLINFLAVRSFEPQDLTESRLFTLSPQSQQVSKNLQQPLKVWVFDRSPNPIDQELLENYRRYGSNFQFEFVDPQVNIGLARQFNVQSFGEVYLEYDDKKQLVQTLSPVERLSEIQLTNAIEKIQRDRTLPVYFLQGHGEAALQASEGGLSQAVSRLEERGYRVNPLNLAQRSELPDTPSVIVVAGPQRPLLEGEVTALQQYLNDGGGLLLLLDPETDPELEPLLENWGVELDNRLIVDASGSGSFVGYDAVTPVVTEYGNHPITENFGNGISVYPLARPIGTVEEEGVDAVSLLITNEQSWAESDLAAEAIAFNPDEDVPGPLDLGIVMTQSRENDPSTQSSDQSPASESRLVVIGNSTFATNGWFDQQLNQDVFLNSVEWLVNDDEQPLSIRPREPKNRRLNLTAAQARTISWLALLIVPLLGLLAAVAAWWRRR